ncbi:MAG: hypothetical protein PWP76_186 [Candidatus Diapherotrites archaeon]|nr:hypothetical protein [Candidatus Diapherotrites archaeon]MDN5367093.1 hypothetical protein [Candidatus Diapherotrites archaeon]
MRGFNPWLIGMIVVFVGAVLFMTLALYGIMAKNAAPKAIDDCRTLCMRAKAEYDLSNGPCLSDIYPDKWNVPDWVCDVAHSPRQPVDNLPENQCSAFRAGMAHHFVEVDENCNVIRIM